MKIIEWLACNNFDSEKFPFLMTLVNENVKIPLKSKGCYIT
jgi:hypothetical protein